MGENISNSLSLLTFDDSVDLEVSDSEKCTIENCCIFNRFLLNNEDAYMYPLI